MEDRLLVESHPVTEECEVVGVVEVVDVVVVGEALELSTVPLSPELCTDPSSYYKRHFYSWITLNFGYKVQSSVTSQPPQMSVRGWCPLSGLTSLWMMLFLHTEFSNQHPRLTL